jgi:transcriptional regulator with XRE-family HTH domain
MQLENLSAADFSVRTDALAEKLGISLRALCVRLDISQPMLWGYRSGKHRITLKALKKIEALEAEATGLALIKSQPGQGKPRTFEDYLAFIRLCRDEAKSLGGGDPAATERIMDRLIATWCMAQQPMEPRRSSPAAAELAELMRQAEANLEARKTEKLKRASSGGSHKAP